MSQKTSFPPCLFPIDLHQHRGVCKQSGFPNDALRNHSVFFFYSLTSQQSAAKTASTSSANYCCV